MMLYPIKFEPILKDRIWGGSALKDMFGKRIPSGRIIGESWELADLPGDCSVIANGELAGMSFREWLDEHGVEMGFTAEQCRYPFGLLIKFLDAQDVLSVQVHPDQRACERFAGARLKTECWYVMSAEPGSVIYRGLKTGVTRSQLIEAVKTGTVQDCLQAHTVHKGDFHFLPAGTIHALGAGIVVAEIQTPSDTTYRLFDWNRKDSQGRSRELHIEQALASIDFASETVKNTHIEVPKTTPDRLDWVDELGRAETLVHCDYFDVKKLSLAQTSSHFTTKQPFVMIVLEGRGVIATGNDALQRYEYRAGETWLAPASDHVELTPHEASQFLMVQLGEAER